MEGELNFNDIIGGGDDKKDNLQQSTAPKMSATNTRARQQSCMITEVDKDLLPSNVTSKPQ